MVSELGLTRSLATRQAHARAREQDIGEWFWQRVQITDHCWLWTGAHITSGYGHFEVNGHHYLAHRTAWELAHGPIPAGLIVCHRCDNPTCVRPDHLFIGTQSDNIHDMITKGRAGSTQHPERLAHGKDHWTNQHPEKVRRGEGSNMAKLRERDVIAIRRLYREAGMRQVDLGQKFGISQAVISSIVLRKTWRHVEDVA